MKESILPKETINHLKLLKTPNKRHKSFKENPKMLLFWVSRTILGLMWLQFIVVEESLFSSKFLNYVRFKIYNNICNNFCWNCRIHIFHWFFGFFVLLVLWRLDWSRFQVNSVGVLCPKNFLVIFGHLVVQFNATQCWKLGILQPFLKNASSANKRY